MVPKLDLQLCACGSGLRRERCCEMDLAASAHLFAAGFDAVRVASATAAWHAGDGELAERLCLDILDAAPGQSEALWILSRLRHAQNADTAALALLSRAVALNPNDARATQDLALRIMRRDGAAAAEALARNAVRVAPLDPQSHIVIAMVLTEALKPQAAEVHYRRAQQLRPSRDPVLLANHALCLRMLGRLDEGRALFTESHAQAPDEVQILLDWAKLEEADQQYTRAAELLDRACQLQAGRTAPLHPGLRLTRAVVQGRMGDTATALATLGDASPPELSANEMLSADEMLLKGRLLDRIGRHDDAFAAFDSARAADRAAGKPQYDEAAASGLASRLRSFFTASRLRTLPSAPPRTDRPQPVFILGFPRSGTTLLEQTLTATPAISPGGELPLLWEVTNAMRRLLGSPLPYPEALSELWMGDRAEAIETLRDHYLYQIHRFGVPRTSVLFTDKMPLNEMHLGLIGLLFPAAPLIHVLRHPLDIVLSTYSNALSHGFYCAASLESVARHYMLITDLVAHYRAQSDLRYLPIRYEDLVHDQERVVRQITEFIGVRFEAAHLRFHENRRHAPTASYAQVTEPLYHRSVGRWRRYRRHLAPVIPILRPAMERLGYALD